MKNERVSEGRERQHLCHCASHGAQERVEAVMDERGRNILKGRCIAADVD